MSNTSVKRPPVIRAINGVGKALSGVGLSGPKFTVDGIRKSAEKISGLSDYGSDSYIPGLEKMCWSLENEAALNQMGRMIMHRQVSNCLLYTSPSPRD